MYFNEMIKKTATLSSQPSAENDLSDDVCSALKEAGITTYHELWSTLYVERAVIPTLTPVMLKKISGFFIGSGCETAPGASERFYEEILERLARREEIARPYEGYELYLRRHFAPNPGDKHEIALKLREICNLNYEDRQPLIEYFGLQLGAPSSVLQIAKLRGLTAYLVSNRIAEVENEISHNDEMIGWMKKRHPEAFHPCAFLT